MRIQTAERLLTKLNASTLLERSRSCRRNGSGIPSASRWISERMVLVVNGDTRSSADQRKPIEFLYSHILPSASAGQEKREKGNSRAGLTLSVKPLKEEQNKGRQKCWTLFAGKLIFPRKKWFLLAKKVVRRGAHKMSRTSPEDICPGRRLWRRPCMALSV